jgi:hypothetical protein
VESIVSFGYWVRRRRKALDLIERGDEVDKQDKTIKVISAMGQQGGERCPTTATP